jgi:hypothetical protein
MTRHSTCLVRIAIGVALATLAPSPALAARPVDVEGGLAQAFREAALIRESIAPPDVFRLARLLVDELELLRLELGKPVLDDMGSSARVVTTGAFPRNVYNQARRLLHDSRKLAGQFAPVKPITLALPTTEIVPADVFAAIEAALHYVRVTKQRLGVTEMVAPRSRDESMTPTDVFKLINRADRQVNLMLDAPSSAADVYDELLLGIRLVAAVCETRGCDPQTPQVELERRRTPADVQDVLLASSELLRQIMFAGGFDAIRFEVRDGDRKRVDIGDLNQVVLGLVSDINHLHLKAVGGQRLRRLRYPGRVFPSHLYRSARQLKQLLERLQRGPTSSAERTMGAQAK